MPKTVAWQAVRCYASGSSLDKTEVYERIKLLLSGFDKVGLGFLSIAWQGRQFGWFGPCSGSCSASRHRAVAPLLPGFPAVP